MLTDMHRHAQTRTHTVQFVKGTHTVQFVTGTHKVQFVTDTMTVTCL